VVPGSEMGIGPKIREIVTDSESDERLNKVETAIWNLFESVTTNFLGNFKEENYDSLVEEILFAYRFVGSKMSLKFVFFELHPSL
jgi:hypothetical protein